MRRRRRQQDVHDALDTFLDTVCNLFGIIIFLAMMIVVLASTTGNELTQARQSDMQLIEEQLHQDLETRRDELNDRLAAYLGHESLAESRVLDELELDLIAANEEVDLRIKMIDAYERRIDSGAKELVDLAGELENIEAEITQLKNRSAAVEQTLNRRFRTPRTTKVDTFPASLMLVNGRLYAPNDWSGLVNGKSLDGGDWCAGMKTWRTTDVDVSKTTALGDCYRTGASRIDREIRLLPNGGIKVNLDRPLESNPDWRKLINQHRSQVQHMIISVAPNSFEHFALVRSALMKKGFRYDIKIADPSFEQTLTHRDSFIPGQPEAQ